MNEQELARLEGLDDEFFALPDIEAPQNAYIDAHSSEFFID
jgi:hypothetical protein